MSIDLADLTNKLIDEAESLFGNSIQDWNFSGIEINERSPSLMYYPETGKVTISLSEKIINDDIQLIFQLSHEVCHLLHPSLEFPSLYKNSTLVINEGLSTYYSVIKMQEYFQNSEFVLQNLRTYSTNYYKAYVLVKNLLDFDIQAIRKIRELRPRIDKLVIDDFEIANLRLGTTLKNNLVEVFK